MNKTKTGTDTGGFLTMASAITLPMVLPHLYLHFTGDHSWLCFASTTFVESPVSIACLTMRPGIGLGFSRILKACPRPTKTIRTNTISRSLVSHAPTSETSMYGSGIEGQGLALIRA